MSELTAERLRERYDYNPHNGKFYVGSGRGFGEERGCAHPKGYIKLLVDRKWYLAHRLAWLYVHGVWPSDVIDHINGIKTDNRLVNLRDITQLENIRAHWARISSSSAASSPDDTALAAENAPQPAAASATISGGLHG